MGIDNIDELKPNPADLRCSAGNPSHVNCTHYIIVENLMIEVAKDELYEYCSKDGDE